MEQVTPIFLWAAKYSRNHQILGSEYLGHQYESGTIINGIRHENVERLSFGDNRLDLIVSTDVFEHVPNPDVAFFECARALKKGGILVASIPFYCARNDTVVRARIKDGKVMNILSPEYHGNPVSPDGSLVFSEFGWDLLSKLRAAGFSEAHVDVYGSRLLGHLGDGQIVFRAVR